MIKKLLKATNDSTANNQIRFDTNEMNKYYIGLIVLVDMYECI